LPIPITSANACPTSPTSSDDHDHESHKPSASEQPGAADVPALNSSWHSQSFHIQKRTQGIRILHDLDPLTQTFSPMGRGHRKWSTKWDPTLKLTALMTVWDFPCPILILLSGLNSKSLAWGHTWILRRAHYIFMCKAPSLTEFESALKLPTDLWRQR
jgi:hypothetical protein